MSDKTQPAPQALAATELFRGLSDAALARVAAGARARRLPKGFRVFSQGDDGMRAHVIVEGGVRISQSGRDGAQVVVRFVGPGEMFGAVAIFTDGLYPAEAVTFAETLEASWSEAELLCLIDHHPRIAINLVRVTGDRLQEAQRRVRELATQHAEQRIAHAVVRLADQAGRDTPEGTVIGFPLRRKDVADIAGTTLHTASRILTAWELAGFVASRNQRLTLRQLARISGIAEDRVD